MSKRYMIALDSGTEKQNDAFIEYINKNGIGWWHWINNFWLLVDTRDKLSATIIRDELDVIYPNVSKIVFELSGGNDTWSGFGPSSKNSNMFTWLKGSWNRAKKS